jgi:uncharacterized protein
MKRVLFVWGGWDGHTPKECVEYFTPWLKQQGYEVEVEDKLDVYADTARLARLNLIVPTWTMGQLTGEQEQGLCGAVAAGVGLAGWHGTMCDSFRNQTDYQFMTGGQWVAHPGNIRPSYDVKIVDREHPITRGLKDFTLRDTEQYYLHVDPSNHVLATTTFELDAGGRAPAGASAEPGAQRRVVMPAVWTRTWGQGRVAYASFGHTWKDF